MKDKRFCVYMHLFPNGKRYIGITCKRPNARWQRGTGYRDGSPVRNAINKYGWDNVEHIILFDNLSQQEACDKEIELIEQYKTNIHRYGDDFGYNMTDGGEGATGHKLKPDVVERLRNCRIGKTGKDCPNSRPVICDGVEYESLKDFMEKNGNPRGSINHWLLGKAGMPYEWYNRGLCYKDIGFSVVRPTTKVNRGKRLIADGVVFDNLTDCGKHFGVSPSAICYYLSGKKATPPYIVESNLRYEDEDTHEFKQWDNTHKRKVRCEIDGVQFESQADLARYIGIKPQTLSAWFSGKNPMPEEYKKRGIKIIE